MDLLAALAGPLEGEEENEEEKEQQQQLVKQRLRTPGKRRRRRGDDGDDDDDDDDQTPQKLQRVKDGIRRNNCSNNICRSIKTSNMESTHEKTLC
jgi:hypothetical protein